MCNHARMIIRKNSCQNYSSNLTCANIWVQYVLYSPYLYNPYDITCSWIPLHIMKCSFFPVALLHLSDWNQALWSCLINFSSDTCVRKREKSVISTFFERGYNCYTYLKWFTPYSEISDLGSPVDQVGRSV